MVNARYDTSTYDTANQTYEVASVVVGPYAPTVVLFNDDDPCPRVQLSFMSFATGTETATVLRFADGGARVVPGGLQKGALGGLVITDNYAPIGTPVQYGAEMFDKNGVSLGFTGLADAFLESDGSTYIQSPTDPRIIAKVDLTDTAGSDLFNPVSGAVYNIGTKRIAITEATQLLSALDMGFFTDTLEQYQAVLQVATNDNGMVVYRTPPPMAIPRVLYAFGAPHRQEFNLPGGFEDFEWVNVVEQISPPTAAIAATLITYQDYVNGFSKYQAFTAAYMNYLDAQTNPPAPINGGGTTDPTKPIADGGFTTDSGYTLLS